MSLFRSGKRGQGPAAAALLLALAAGAAHVAHAQDLGPLRGTLSGTAPEAAGTDIPAHEAAQPADPITVAAIPRQPAPPEGRSTARDLGEAGFLEAARAEREAFPADVPGLRRLDDTLLPESGEDDTAQADIRRIDTHENMAVRPDGPVNVRAGAIGRIATARSAEPFAPVGLRIGTFDVFPQFEQGLTATSNADASPAGRSALLSESTLRLRAVSGWSGGDASVDGYGTMRRTLSGQDVADIEGALNADLRRDITSGLRGTASFRYALFPEDASSPVAIAGVDTRPLHHVIAAGIGAEKALGKVRLQLAGDVLRDQYGDADLTDGTTLSQKDRNSTLATVRLRGGYEISPALTPFAELELGRRFYDQERDAAGYARSANRMAARAGVALDLRDKLSGEFSAGWVNEDPQDDRLEPISGPSLAASLAWSPVRETTIRLDGATLVEGSTTPGETGSILYSGLLTAERRMRADLTGTAALGLGYRSYDIEGHEMIASAELGLTWWLNRYAGLTGRARYELLRSDLPDRDYDAASVFLGMTVQR